jgi:hypothetical protein
VTRLKWKLVSVRLDIVLILIQDRGKIGPQFAPNVTKPQKPFGTHPLELLEIVLVLVLGRGTICAKCTVGSEIIFGAPVGTPW